MNQVRKTFSIYKIQHHGSRFETAAYRQAKTTETTRENALLFTLLAHYRSCSTWVTNNLLVYFGCTLPKGDTRFKDAIKYLVDQMKAMYKVTDDEYIAQNYVRPLLDRHNGYFNHIRQVGQNGAISHIKTFGNLPDTEFTARDDPWDAWRAITKDIFNLVYSPGQAKGALQRTRYGPKAAGKK